MAEAGMDPLRFLDERDPFVRQLMLNIAVGHHEREMDKQQALAMEVVNALSKAMKK